MFIEFLKGTSNNKHLHFLNHLFVLIQHRQVGNQHIHLSTKHHTTSQLKQVLTPTEVKPK